MKGQVVLVLFVSIGIQWSNTLPIGTDELLNGGIENIYAASKYHENVPATSVGEEIRETFQDVVSKVNETVHPKNRRSVEENTESEDGTTTMTTTTSISPDESTLPLEGALKIIYQEQKQRESEKQPTFVEELKGGLKKMNIPVDSASEKFENVKEKGKEKLQEAKEKGQEKFHEAKEKGQEKFQEAKEKGQEKFQQAKEKVQENLGQNRDQHEQHPEYPNPESSGRSRRRAEENPQVIDAEQQEGKNPIQESSSQEEENQGIKQEEQNPEENAATSLEEREDNRSEEEPSPLEESHAEPSSQDSGRTSQEESKSL